MQFILPKIIGITVLAGIVTFVAATIFKLLLVGTLLFGVLTLIRKFADKRQNQMSYSGGSENFREMKKSNFNNFNPTFQAAKSEAAIYPIY